MKLANEAKQVSYGVANGASYWMTVESAEPKRKFKRSKTFWAFRNCAAATKAAKQVVGGYVVRRVSTVSYERDA